MIKPMGVTKSKLTTVIARDDKVDSQEIIDEVLYVALTEGPTLLPCYKPYLDFHWKGLRTPSNGKWYPFPTLCEYTESFSTYIQPWEASFRNILVKGKRGYNVQHFSISPN